MKTRPCRNAERIMGPVPARPGWVRVAINGRVRYRHESGLEVVQPATGGWVVELAGERPFDPHRRAQDALDQAQVLLDQAAAKGGDL